MKMPRPNFVAALVLALAGAPAAPALVVHYRTDWSAPRAHYDAGGGWTASPGRAMQAEGGGWFSIRLSSSRAQIAFNDGAGHWDPGSGGSYRVEGTEVWIAGGTAFKRRPDPGRIVHHPRFASGLLRNERDLWVYLPAGYDAGADRFPVLYLNDGNNVFDRKAMHGGWQADATLDRLIALGEVEPVVAVAISNTPARMSEYTPTADDDHGGGQADLYLRFLVEELKPFVDRTYRTRRDAAATGLLGSSLGGLQTFHAAWKRSEVFGLCGAMSPSFWWDDRALLREVQAHRGRRPAARFWLDSGDQGPSADGMADTAAMRDTLAAMGYTFGKDLAHYLDRGAGHDEVAWRNRLGLALAFLYPPVDAPAPAPREVKTVFRVHYDVGWGHRIGLRGTAPGWGDWKTEIQARWTAGNVWVYETTSIPEGTAFEFKVVADGTIWEAGANRAARAGDVLDVSPRFP